MNPPLGETVLDDPDADAVDAARPPAAEDAMSEALDPAFYTSREVLEREHERIFARSWQVVAHVQDLPNPRSYVVGRPVARSRPPPRPRLTDWFLDRLGGLTYTAVTTRIQE